MSRIDIQGGCFCGEVRYRSAAEPIHSTICHCGDCRRAAGAQSVAWVTFRREAFSFTAGQPVRFKSSPPVIRTFCGRCGTSLTYERDDRPGEIDVTTGSLADPEAFPPTQHVFSEQKLSWV